MAEYQILVGDVMDRLAGLPSQHFHACVTSPPFWGLRSYLPDDHPDKTKELGREKTPEEFVANLVQVFSEVRRVLRDDGVCWLELGDSYSGAGRGGNPESSRHQKQRTNRGSLGQSADTSTIRQGNQLLMPHRVALALQVDGWTLRQTVHWIRKSPMPESVSGTRWARCRVKVGGSGNSKQTTSGPFPQDSHHRGNRGGSGAETNAEWADCPGCPKCEKHDGYVLKRGSWRHTTASSYVFMLTKGMKYHCDAEAAKGGGGTAGVVSSNPRNHFLLATESYREAHFATFPATLIYKLLHPVIGQSQCCPECGSQWAPVVDSQKVLRERPNDYTKRDGADGTGNSCANTVAGVATSVLGYWPTCDCAEHSESHSPVPCRVLDCFAGSCTTGQVCQYLGAEFIGIELFEEYARLGAERIQTPWEPKLDGEKRKPVKKKPQKQAETAVPRKLPLFPE